MVRSYVAGGSSMFLPVYDFGAAAAGGWLYALGGATTNAPTRTDTERTG